MGRASVVRAGGAASGGGSGDLSALCATDERAASTSSHRHLLACITYRQTRRHMNTWKLTGTNRFNLLYNGCWSVCTPLSVEGHSRHTRRVLIIRVNHCNTRFSECLFFEIFNLSIISTHYWMKMWKVKVLHPISGRNEIGIKWNELKEMDNSFKLRKLY